MFLTRDIAAGGHGPADDFWYMPVGNVTLSGARVSPQTAMRLSTVYKCVRVTAETIGMLPCIVYRRLQNGGKERAPMHPLWPLLHGQPNPWQTQMQWREMMQGHATLRGNGFSEIVYNGAGRPEMLLPMHPDRTCVEVTAPGRPPRYRYTDEAGRERVLVSGEVLHLSGMSADGYVGLSPIEAEREAIGAAIATRDYGTRYFANDARFPGWISFDGKFKDDEARRGFRQQFQDAHSGVNSGRVAVLEHGMKYNELGVKNSDAQFIESRKMQDVDIAGIFRMPPHKIGILDQSKWANIEQQALEFVSDLIMPWAVRWEQCLQRDLDFGEDYFPEILLDMLLRGDTKTRYDAYGKGIQDGWLTRNEARVRENLNPLDGLDTPLEPMNMTPAGSRGASQARGEPPSAQQRLSVERSVLIQQAAAARVARKELAAVQRVAKQADAATAIAEFYAAHAEFVAEVMAVPHAAALGYCQQTAQSLAMRVTEGTLGALGSIDFTDIQTAALLRLGDH